MRKVQKRPFIDHTETWLNAQVDGRFCAVWIDPYDKAACPVNGRFPLFVIVGLLG